MNEERQRRPRTVIEKIFIVITFLVIGGFVLAALAFGTCLLMFAK